MQSRWPPNQEMSLFSAARAHTGWIRKKEMLIYSTKFTTNIKINICLFKLEMPKITLCFSVKFSTPCLHTIYLTHIKEFTSHSFTDIMSAI